MARKLTSAERELWRKVVKTLDHSKTPHRSHADAPPATPPIATPMPKPTQPHAMKAGARDPGLPHFRVGERAGGPKHMLQKPAQPRPTAIDARLAQKMGRGKVKPEGKIDLHGMTAAQAHARVQSFVMDAFAQEKRLVLVITGKGGRNQPEMHYHSGQEGVLRRALPVWLTLPPLHDKVLYCRPAHIRHGGEGAFYVYLKRRRGG